MLLLSQVGDHKNFKRCSRCRAALYCGLCDDSDRWYDKYRGCKGGSMHEGKLELMTWEWTNHDIGCRVGWGNSLLEDAAETRRRFEVDCRGKKSLFYKHARRLRPPRWWEQAVHFCHMGKPLPDGRYYKEDGVRMGLKLNRGPDPRSFHPGLAATAATGRTLCGLEI
ncbi:hypothetical protein C8Q72DRAFT_948599 [Fomitopsis betulina]|nr:hypothetical protein C8Q72DRAFT_948599 [Fomitopsis betulina]